MINCGWRTVTIENKSKLSIEDDRLVIETDFDKKSIATSQIGVIVISDERTTLSSKVLTELTKNDVKVIFCNEKHSPECEIIPYYANSFVTAQFVKQISWKEYDKAYIWQKIVSQKIINQAELIKYKSKEAYELMCRYLNEVLPNDETNRESQAARIYFNTLFGKDFNRRENNTINAALNYGYAIILSTVNRFVCIYGYHTALGIKHCSAENPYNLSCDLMEPFRPVVDGFIYENQDRELDFSYKKDILSLMYSKIQYKGQNVIVNGAIELFVKDVLTEMSGEKNQIGEIKIGT